MNRKNKTLQWLFQPAPSALHRWVVDRPVAHRGLFDPTLGIPENSMAAFKRAVDYGFSIELDVRLLADGELAVFHDRSLERMTGQSGVIDTLTTTQFRKLRLTLDNQPPPLLKDVFELVGRQSGILVEIKDPSPLAAQAVVAAAKNHPGPWAALSFHASVIAWFAHHHPLITRGLNGGTFEKDTGILMSFRIRHFLHVAKARPHFLGCHLQRLNAPVPRWLRSHGLPVIAWTARSPNDYLTSKKQSDAVIFEGFIP